MVASLYETVSLVHQKHLLLKNQMHLQKMVLGVDVPDFLLCKIDRDLSSATKSENPKNSKTILKIVSWFEW